MHVHDDDFAGEEVFHFAEGETSAEIEGLEMLKLRSVGIDIGSSTTHLVFSRLTLRRAGAGLSTQFQIADREVLYRSPIMLTPYLSGTLIDTDRVIGFIHGAYGEAGLTPGQIDTGAVVITGEALKKENAQPIAEFFAKDSGKFICASAGPNHEALLAAHGCGAVALSKAERATVLNIDMGGGTTKLAVIRDGAVQETAAVNVGARLIAFDETGTITRLEEPAKVIMGSLGHEVALGGRVGEAQRDAFARAMASVVLDVAGGSPSSDLAKELMITSPLRNGAIADARWVVFSGGVSEYVYQHEARSYGDVGPLFGAHVRGELARLGIWDRVREPSEGIRATVIGAGEYTLQASGNTSYLSDLGALPAWGLKVVRLDVAEGEAVQATLARSLGRLDLEGYGPGLAIALSLPGVPTYRSLRRVAEGISAVVQQGDGASGPLYLTMAMDVAKSLGGMLKEELRLEQEVVAVDGIQVGELDYMDIGLPVGISEVVPVTVKSLVFSSHR